MPDPTPLPDVAAALAAGFTEETHEPFVFGPEPVDTFRLVSAPYTRSIAETTPAKSA